MIDRTGNTGTLFEFLGFHFDGRDDAEGIQHTGAQRAQNIVGGFHAPVYQRFYAFGLGEQFRVIVMQAFNQPNRVDLDGGKCAAHVVVNIACDMEAFLLAGILDVRRKFAQLFLRLFQPDAGKFALADVGHDAFPQHIAVVEFARSATHIDPFYLAVLRHHDASLPVPQRKLISRNTHGLVERSAVVRVQNILE